MCGIAGYVGPELSAEVIDSMLEYVAHRGPNNHSVYRHQQYCLGHRRLSIIDLQSGNQPIFNEDESIAIVFNGEIYNYRELRKELIDKGHHFYTASDTEVIVHLYEEYGPRCAAKLNGIFAFAILDKNNDQLVLCRDHFGVKPLHFYTYPDGILFGSEQKSFLAHPAFKPEVNRSALHSHLNLRYTAGDETLLKGVKRLNPGHFAIYKNFQLYTEAYWELNLQPQPRMSEAEAIEKLHFYLKQAVQRQLVSDVPIGVYLSGGLDSSAIVQKMHELGVPEIHTFTMGFNEPTDEFPDADRIAKHFHTHHHTLSLSMNPMQQLPEVIWHAEEPKINLLQGYNMSNFVHDKVSVILGGLGGDELLAGYDIHHFLSPMRNYSSKIPGGLDKLMHWKSDLLFKMQNATKVLAWDEYRRGMQMLLAVGNIERAYLILRNVWDEDTGMYNNIYASEYLSKYRSELKKTSSHFDDLFRKVKHLDSLDQVLHVEFQTKMLNDYLLTDDRMSMAHSVEERVPFLDKDFVEFCFSVPNHLKVQNGQTKSLFRKAMSPYLPPDIIAKKKWGFTVNPYLQFKKDLKDTAEHILTKEYIQTQGIFNYSYIKTILEYPANPRLRWHYNLIWVMVGYAIWEDQYLKGVRSKELNDYYKK
jgi:asparagine synthase (glutamine-hydrolysing)